MRKNHLNLSRLFSCLVFSRSGIRSRLIAPAILFLAIFSHAQNDGKRCDLLIKSTPGAGAETACLDLKAINAPGGSSIQTAQNATRISRDGIIFCKNAFAVPGVAEADIVFIYDNSGSMTAKFAWINPTTQDTVFYFNTNGCASGDVGSNLTYQTAEGPRTVPLLVNNAGCRSLAGDPYMARGAVIRQGIDFLGSSSPGSTGGAVAFTDVVAHQQPLVQLNTPANISLLKNSIVLDSAGGTHYGPPLRQAGLWLADPSLTRTAKKAIVFLSDGAPTDLNQYEASIPREVPIYSIFLGDPTTDYARLNNLSTRTGGTFYLVDPDNVAKMNEVMQEIIRAITVVTLPKTVEISNSSLNPGQKSLSLSMERRPQDGNVTVTLDSILALKQGVNDITVKVNLEGGKSDTYKFKVQADGPAAINSNPSLACFEQPTLVMLNSSNQVDPSYPLGPSGYAIRLTRSPSELTGVTVAANAGKPPNGGPPGDVEAINLPFINVQSGVATNHLNRFSLQMSAPVRNNGVLEVVENGLVVLKWSHPRDVRETASFSLPGQKVNIIPGFIEVERVIPVTQTTPITEPISDPIVIRGGAVLTQTGPGVVNVDSRGCLYNCNRNIISLSDPNKTPSFIFKVSAPFSFQLFVYDHLGQFVLESRGAVKPADWEAMPKTADSVAVVMSIIPVTSSGQPWGNGVYILNATITTEEMAKNDSATPSKISRARVTFTNKFGYMRSAN